MSSFWNSSKFSVTNLEIFHHHHPSSQPQSGSQFWILNQNLLSNQSKSEKAYTSLLRMYRYKQFFGMASDSPSLT